MSVRLRVDPIACEAHGMCMELLPELIRPDDWGYPIVAPGPVPPELEDHARRAADACPVLAVLLEADRSPRPERGSPRRQPSASQRRAPVAPRQPRAPRAPR